MSEHGLELIEARFPQSNGAVADHAGDGAADAVVAVAVLFDHLGHAGGGVGRGAAHRHEGVDLLARDGGDEGEEGWVAGGGGVGGGGWE